MHCHGHQTLNYIWAGQISYDNVYKGSKIVRGDKNIDSLLNVVAKKVRTFCLYMCFTFQNNSCNFILKNIVTYNVFTFAWASK